MKRLLGLFGCWLFSLTVWGQSMPERSYEISRLAPDLKQPISLYADSAGNFWVGDGKSKRVFCFGPEGELRQVIGDKKKDKIGFPLDMAADRAGRVHILDSQERLVLIFDAFGERQGQLGGSKTFARPSALAVDDSDNVFVVEEARRKILAFDLYKRPVYTIEETVPGQPLQKPVAAAADRQGNFYILDAGQNALLIYDGARKFKQALPLQSDNKNFPKPVDLAVGAQGEIFILDAGEPAVWYLSGWRATGWRKVAGSDREALQQPVSLVLTGGGKLFVLDAGPKEVKKFSVKGLAEAAPSTTMPAPAAGPKGFITSLKDSGDLLVPFVDYQKGLALLQPFDASGTLADWVLDSDIRLTIGGEPLTLSSPVSLLKSDLKLAVAIVWGIEKLGSEEQEELKNGFAQQIFPELDEPNDKLFLFAAGARPEAILEAEGNTHTASMALDNLRPLSDGLGYYDAVLKANERLQARSPELLPVVILVTDGADRSSSASYRDIILAAEEKGVANVYVVAFDDGQKGAFLSDLRRVSEATQGIYFETNEAKNFAQMLARLVKALKYQLVVRFTPPEGGGVLSAEVILEKRTVSASSAKSGYAPPPAEEKSDSKGVGWKTVLLAGGTVLILALLGVGLVIVLKKRGRKCPVCGHKVESSWTFCYFCKAPLLAPEKKSRGMPAAVTIQKGQLSGMRFPLNQPVVTIGSSKENQIAVDYEGISRRHARIEKNGSRWEIVDLNSTNHTYLNGKPVSRAALKNKDVISLARVADLIFED